MPQIPTLPIDEPVSLTQAKPQQFGSAGDTVAGLGEETEQLAQSASQFEAHLAYAQRSLKAKQAEVAVGALEQQTHADLGKTTTPEQAQAVYDDFQKKLQLTLAPYENDPVLARELGIYGQQTTVVMQGTLNAHKAKVLTESTNAADAVLMESSSIEAINTKVAGGDYSGIEASTKAKLQNSVATGVKTQEQVDSEFAKWQREVQKGVIIANINSQSSAARKDTIAQLSKGGGTLDHSMLSAGDIAQLRTHAVDTDHSLSQKEEAGNLNNALNTTHSVFQSPEFKHTDGTPNFEAQTNALDDGQFLTDNGIVTPEGKPDYIMAEKLQQDLSRKWQIHEKVQHDKDEAVMEKYAPQLYDPKRPLTLSQIEMLPQTEGASSKVVNNLKSQLFQQQREARAEQRANRQLSIEERQIKQQQEQQQSFETLGKLQLDLQQGKRYSDSDIYGMVGKGDGKLSPQQASEAIRMSHSFENDPANKPFYSSIWNQQFQPEVMGELISEFDDYIRKNPSATPIEKSAKVKEITDQHNIKRVNDAIDGITEKLNGPAQPSAFSKWWQGMTAKPVRGSMESAPASSNRTIESDTVREFSQQGGDYDVAGYEKEFGKGSYAAKAGKEHFPDTYKNPSHITFSTDSKQSGPGHEGGTWKKSDNVWHFTPSEFNLSQHSIKEYTHYFDTTEKNSVLEINKDGKRYKYIGNDQWQTITKQ